MMKHRSDKLANHRRRILVAVMVWLFVGSTAFGQDGRLSVDLATSSPRVRSNAPVQLLLKTFWNGSSIVEGHFEMMYFSDGVTLRSRCTSQDIVLTPGEQVIRLSLPSGGSTVSYGQDEVGLNFAMPDSTIGLGKYTLMANPSDRSMNICLIGPTEDRTVSDAEAEVTDSMRLNSLLPEVRARSVATIHTRWDNVDVPEQAFHFCSFDLVVLRPEGLADLRKKQMDAILAWVRAGGSVCVMLSDEMKGTHVEFLNALVAEQHDAPFSLGIAGQFVSDNMSADDGIWTSHLELGRAAVVNLSEMPSGLDVLFQNCRRMSAFLWRIRKSQESDVLSQSRASVAQTRQGNDLAIDPVNRIRNRGRISQLSWQPIQTTGQFINRLMPEDVKVVPLFLIAMVLIGYLILIGPVDYFLLGFFRARRFTWLTFPLLTGLVSLLCVGISDSYLSSKKDGRTLTVRDIGADGAVLRETRFQMRFLSRKAKVETEVKNEIFTPLDQDRLNMNAQYMAYQDPSVGQKKYIPTYSGRMPSDYVVEQEIPQWTPQINRFLSIAPGNTIEGFAWDDKSLVDKSNHGKLSQLARQRWPDCTAIVFHGDDRTFVAGSRIFRLQDNMYYDPRYGNVQYRGRNARNSGEANMKVSFMDSLCVRSPAGLFRFVSQISPTGGDNFEDVTVYDASNESQALLVIAHEEGDDLVIERRLYTNLNDQPNSEQRK